MANKTCTKCRESKPLEQFSRNSRTKDGYRSSCKLCQADYQKKWREANREKLAAQKKAYYEANRAKALDCNRAWREANKERYAARKKEYLKAYRQTAEGRAKRRAAQTRYYRLLAEAKSEPYLREEIFERDGWVCQLCDEPIDPTIRYEDDPGECATIDHVVPLSLGGDDTPANVQAAHGSCNYGKCNRVEVEEVA